MPAPDTDHRLRERQGAGQGEGEISEFRDHVFKKPILLMKKERLLF
jgi:hypothetical protein